MTDENRDTRALTDDELAGWRKCGYLSETERDLLATIFARDADIERLREALQWSVSTLRHVLASRPVRDVPEMLACAENALVKSVRS